MLVEINVGLGATGPANKDCGRVVLCLGGKSIGQFGVMALDGGIRKLLALSADPDKPPFLDEVDPEPIVLTKARVLIEETSIDRTESDSLRPGYLVLNSPNGHAVVLDNQVQQGVTAVVLSSGEVLRGFNPNQKNSFAGAWTLGETTADGKHVERVRLGGAHFWDRKGRPREQGGLE